MSHLFRCRQGASDLALRMSAEPVREVKHFWRRMASRISDNDRHLSHEGSGSGRRLRCPRATFARYKVLHARSPRRSRHTRLRALLVPARGVHAPPELVKESAGFSNLFFLATVSLFENEDIKFRF